MKCAVKRAIDRQKGQSLDNFINLGLNATCLCLKENFGFGKVRINRMNTRVNHFVMNDMRAGAAQYTQEYRDNLDDGLYKMHKVFDETIHLEDIKFGTKFDAYINLGVKLCYLALQYEFNFGRKRLGRLNEQIYNKIFSQLAVCKKPGWDEFELMTRVHLNLKDEAKKIWGEDEKNE